MSIFTKVATKKRRYNTFNLSCDRKLSIKFGQLVPIHVEEVIPGDSFNFKCHQLTRFAPLVAPVMHRVNIYTHFFFVPNRILWSNWGDFIIGGPDGDSNPVFPFIDLSSTNASPGTLADYLGIPSFPAGPPQRVSALPFAAYQLIYDEYYRDQNLEDRVTVEGDVLSDGDNSDLTEILDIRNRAWHKDYFTSALPWTQRGSEATIPIGTTAPIEGSEPVTVIDGVSIPGVSIKSTDGGDSAPPGDMTVGGDGSAPVEGKLTVNRSGTYESEVHVDPNGSLEVKGSGGLVANLQNAVAASINSLRRAFRLQEWLETNARSGSRYNEQIKGHFGVNVPDARLQRPEFLGGGKSPVVISEVLQTAATDQTTTPQGNMAGHGISSGSSYAFNKRFVEHGWIIGIMSVLPQPAYQQGLPKKYFKFDRFDYFFPEFANIGEQPILNKELYADNTDGLDDEVFGYTPRYAEYKFNPSTVHGEFKTTLDKWHMGRKFSERPLLNAEFVKMMDAEVERVFAVMDSEKLYVHVYHDIRARRMMPYFGTPTI